MSYINPSTDNFKTYFNRDFPYGCNIDEHILDSDIDKAMSMASIEIPDCCFDSQAAYDQAFYLLSAHYLLMNIRSSSQGLSGTFSWAMSSHSVGSVSESFAVPTTITENPLYANFTKTSYGGQYLMMIYPCLVGNIFTVGGGTLA